MKLKSLLLKKEISNFIKDTVLILVTMLLWIIFLAYLIWIIVSIKWKLIETILFDELYIPGSITFISNIILGLIIWAILASIMFLIMCKNNNYNNKNTFDIEETFDNYNDSLTWKELVYSNSNPKDNYMISQKLLSNEELYYLSPFKMLSYGVTLYNNKLIKEAISVMRLVLEHPESNSLLIEITECKLVQMLPYLGEVGINITEKMEEGRLNHEKY